MKRFMSLEKVVVLLLWISPALAVAQAKYDKMLTKVEASYTTGNYSKAISGLNKFKKKAFKKLGQQNVYTPTYYMRLAKYNLASGYINEFETNVQQAVSSSKGIHQENSKSYGLILVEAAELHNMNGSYRVAREYLTQAKEVLEGGDFMKDLTKGRYELALAETLTGQGYYSEAIEILNEQERFYAGRAVKQETFVDDKGNLKSRKLSDEELTERYEKYGYLRSLLGWSLSSMGRNNAADSIFDINTDFLKKNLGQSNIEYVRNQFLIANHYLMHGLQAGLRKDVNYSTTLNNLKIKYNPGHYLAIPIYENYLRELQKSGSSAKYLNTKLEYEKMIAKNYTSKSIYNVRLKAVEFDAKLDKDRTKNLEAQANNLIANTASLPKNNIITANVIEFLYGLALYKKNYTNAEKYLNEIVEIKADLFGSDAPETHLARLQLANFYIDNTNKVNEAAKIYEDSYVKVVSKEIGPSHKDHLDILNHMAALYELTDRYSDADQVLQKALYVAQNKFDNGDYEFADELTKIARLQIKLGQYEKAEDHLNSSIKILDKFRKEENKKIYYVQAIETQATLYGIKGMFDEAEANLDRSARVISRAKKLTGLDELSTARELSSLLIQLGRYSQTEGILNDLITESEKLYGTSSVRLIDPLVDKGRLLLAKGDYTEAEKVAQRVNKIATTVYGERSTKTAPAQKLLADIDYAIGDYDNAEQMLVKSLASLEKQFGRNHIEVAKVLSQLGMTKFHKGDKPAEIEKLLFEARNIMSDKLGNQNPQYAEILKNVASLYISQKKYPEAFSVLTQAEAIWRTKTGTKTNINAANIYALTGDVYYATKNYKRAEEFYVQAKKIYEDYFSKTHPEYVKLLSKQAKVYYMEKNYKRAKSNIEEALNNYEAYIKQIFPALSEREKAKYWNTIKGDFEFYNTLAFSQLEDFRDLAGKVYDYQLLTKALLLSTSIKIRERILNSTDEALKTSYNLWVEKKEQLTNALSMSTQQLADNGFDINQMTAEAEKLEREISQKSELFGQSFDNKKIKYTDVQKAIGKNDVAIEMVRYRHFNHTFTDSVVYVALYVKNDNARPKAIIMPQGLQMETRYFRYYRNSIIGKIQDQNSYKVFWEPIQKGIGTATTIYLSADGVYNQINLEAIPTPDGKYIIDNANIVLVSNTKDLYLNKVRSRPVAASNTATMFGNPKFYLTASTGNIAALPGTEREVAQLDGLLKQRSWSTNEYVETYASEDKVKDLSSPKILHFATHGFYTPAIDQDELEQLTESEATMAENPLLKTGLLLTGAGDIFNETKYNYNIASGILTAYEAMSLNLDQTDLVVLSACETGLGKIENGEGVYGLQRAFLVAGAKVLIMSMFKVDDDATQKLIINFYRKWLATNDMRQSFTDAKKELRVEYPEPYYWAPFMMIGQQ
ncbi:MAG: CHAT domain-containing protein [Cyclobacteriaceae bacterium]|nr:CHAT domain-containing protein [Cyclobacteriaceae bacterium]